MSSFVHELLTSHPKELKMDAMENAPEIFVGTSQVHYKCKMATWLNQIPVKHPKHCIIAKYDWLVVK